MKVAIILNSGKPVNRRINADKIICADGGINFCPVTPDIIIGDGDSIKIFPQDIKFIEYPEEKNFTDGEACVHYAKEIGATEVEFYGIIGGRYDHTLGNFAMMNLCDSLNMIATAKENKNLDIYLAKNHFLFDANKNDLISIIPIGGDAKVSNSKGLKYPLDNLKLTTTDSRGISNVATSKEVSFDVTYGKVLVFHYMK